MNDCNDSISLQQLSLDRKNKPGAAITQRGLATAFPPAFLQRWDKLLSLTPLELGIDPCPIRLAGAVAGSASFPPLVGPITFTVGEEDLYWHAGDGGLYENQGIESLLFVFLKQLQEKTARRPWRNTSPRSPHTFGWRPRVTTNYWPPRRSWRRTSKRSSLSWKAGWRADVDGIGLGSDLTRSPSATRSLALVLGK
jgi:hypothetical protein